MKQQGARSGSRPPVLLLHAFPLSAAMWDGVIARMAAERDVLAVDYPGFGGRPAAVGEPDLGVFADDIAAELDRRGTGPVIAVGLSLGGYVMVELVRRRPDLLAGLVFADTRVTPDSPSEAGRRAVQAARIRADGHVESLVTDYLPACLTATTRADVRTALHRMVRTAEPEGVAWTLHAMAARTDGRAALRAGGLGLPGGVIVGSDDALCSASDRATLRKALGGARAYGVPDAGHYSAVDNPQGFAAALKAYLQDWNL
ncbi:alpha/beta fold hydrolase [Streptomyces albus subsp. chlorinus]|uniref:alpha/beta fold hydrolase n=1 Tax=Streptomyces albus TaxID=1888 RepID=UPI001570244B|nr:alpha/beta hydrolase [Streptomyces albus]NSC25622.1 alpha/beta fold hydrolase [Streptomyces albus subsp. chlorinus]